MIDSRISLPVQDPVSGTGPTKDNGRVPTSYDQTVSPKKPPSKADIEAQLQLASESITSRVQAIQDEFNLTTEAVRSFFGNPVVGIVAALGAGLIVGRLLGGSKKDARGTDPDSLASLLISEVEEALATGESPEEAIHRVVHAVGSPHTGSAKSSGSALKWIAGLALRSALSQGIRAFTSARTETSDSVVADESGLEDFD